MHLQHSSILFSWARRKKFLDMNYTKKDRLLANEAKWKGEECPDEGGGERLEKFGVLAKELFSTLLARSKYRLHTSPTSVL